MGWRIVAHLVQIKPLLFHTGLSTLPVSTAAHCPPHTHTHTHTHTLLFVKFFLLLSSLIFLHLPLSHFLPPSFFFLLNLLWTVFMYYWLGFTRLSRPVRSLSFSCVCVCVPVRICVLMKSPPPLPWAQVSPWPSLHSFERRARRRGST